MFRVVMMNGNFKEILEENIKTLAEALEERDSIKWQYINAGYDPVIYYEEYSDVTDL